MTSSFERLPYEVLDNIATRLSDAKDDLRQFQLLNKRCQSVAEKQLFRELVLPSHNDDLQRIFLENPQRCSYVRALDLEGDPAISFDDEFFGKFRHIERIYSSFDYDVSWQSLSEAFTSERYKLKELPLRCANISNAELYLKMLQDHSHTLEKLKYYKGSYDVHAPSELEEAGKSFGLPQLKSLHLMYTDSTFFNLCNTIDMFSSLEEVEIDLQDKYRYSSPIPTTQHQRLMKRLAIRSCTVNIASVCTYLATKFPNAQEWNVYTFDINFTVGEDFIAPFEEYANSLHSIMKSSIVNLSILVPTLSYPKIFHFLEKIGAAATTISINYEAAIPFNPICDSVVFLLQKRNSKIASVEFSYGSMKFGNLDVLKKCGKHIQKLDLAMTCDICIFRNQFGGAIVQVLNNCPNLTSFIYRAEILSAIDHKKTRHKNLKKMVLVCNTIEGKVLESLSKIAPKISDLTIKSSFDVTIRSGAQTEIRIYMPGNSFDKLILKDSGIWGWDSSTLVSISTTNSKRQKTQYYIQKFSGGKREAITSLSEEEYGTRRFGHKRRYASISITCKSINYLKYYFDIDSQFVPGISGEGFELQLQP